MVPSIVAGEVSRLISAHIDRESAAMRRSVYFTCLVLCLLLPLWLAACGSKEDNDSTSRAEPYRMTPDMTPASSASLTVGRKDAGFLSIGTIEIRILTIDGERVLPPYDTAPAGTPLLLTPGAHIIFAKASHGSVAAYACMSTTLAQGHAYVLRTSKPDLGGTQMWLEDQAGGQVLGQKFTADTANESQSSGFLLQSPAHSLHVC
jgi:hypothetical protein